jgi:flagellar P-ring protein precursor FlgI
MKRSNLFLIGIILSLAAFTALQSPAQGQVPARVKDIATVAGVRSNQLMGYGLVVGLDDTGDTADFTAQSIAAFLSRQGMNVNSRDVETDNVAAVVVTAELPAFAREGSRIDITVSCLGDAESLQGGTLLLTPLFGADNEVYAVAQGAISIGGFNYSAGGNRVQSNHPTVGRIPSGAIIEKEVRSPMVEDFRIRLLLFEPDFTTAFNLAQAINAAFEGQPLAEATDSGTVDVDAQGLTTENIGVVEAISRIESLMVISDVPARVVINERTGTVVAGNTVRISTVAISHAGISVEVTSTPEVSQPEPFSRRGETVVLERTDLYVEEEESPIALLEESTTIGDLVESLNAFGVARPRDLIAVFQALKAAGALRAELVIM